MKYKQEQPVRGAKKILVISYEFPPHGGGAGVVAQDFITNFSQQYEITLLTLNRADIKARNAFLIKANTYRPLRFIGVGNELKKLNLTSYHRIIINDLGAALVSCLYLDSAALSKSIVFLHGSEPEIVFEKPELLHRLLNFKSLYTSLLDSSKYVVAVSEYMKKKFFDRTGLTHLQDKIKVITNGVDSSLFKPQHESIRKAFGIPDDAKLLLSVSRIESGKGYQRMLRVFKTLSKHQQNLYWIIVGNGPYKKEMESLVTANNLNERVRFVGKVKRAQLPQFYSSANVFWLLSEYNEALGLVYIEANFCGVPAIGNNKGGVTLIIKNGINGYLIDEKNDLNAVESITKAIEQNWDSSLIKQTVAKYEIKKNIQGLTTLID